MPPCSHVWNGLLVAETPNPYCKGVPFCLFCPIFPPCLPSSATPSTSTEPPPSHQRLLQFMPNPPQGRSVPKREDERERYNHPAACTCVDCVNRFLKQRGIGPTSLPCPSCLNSSGVEIETRTGRKMRCPTCLGSGRVSRVFMAQWESKRAAEALLDAERRARDIQQQDAGQKAPEPHQQDEEHPPGCKCDACMVVRIRNWRSEQQPRVNRSGVPSVITHSKSPYCACAKCKTRRAKPFRKSRRRSAVAGGLLLLLLLLLFGGGLAAAILTDGRGIDTPASASGTSPGSFQEARAVGEATPFQAPTTPLSTLSQPPLTPTPTPTPPPVPHLLHVEEKEYMLELINQRRADAGSPSVVLGDNDAAQLHADANLANCSSSHWGADGLKPYMRYSLAGGYQANAENVSGLDYCIKFGEGYTAIGSTLPKVRDVVQSFMESPGHRDNLLNPSHKKVNIGFAWDTFNFFTVQHFEGDYVHYTTLPSLEDGVLSLKGRVKNGAFFGAGRQVPLTVQYDPPAPWVDSRAVGEDLLLYRGGAGGANIPAAASGDVLCPRYNLYQPLRVRRSLRGCSHYPRPIVLLGGARRMGGCV